MDTFDLTDTQASILLRLGRAGRPEAFLHPRSLNLTEIEDYSRQMTVLESLGLVEHKVIGARVRHWRLTEAGWAAMPKANAMARARWEANMRHWREHNEVYGVPRPQGAAALGEGQQRAWVQGWLLAHLMDAPVPADAPAEVRENFDKLRRLVARKLRPHCPFADPPEPVTVPKPAKPPRP